MDFVDDLTDDAVLQELGGRLARLRLNRNRTQEELAAEAGISLRTLQRIERGDSTHAANLIRVLRELDLLANLEALVPPPAISPLQQLKLQGKRRRRASSRGEQPEADAPWTWGDEE